MKKFSNAIQFIITAFTFVFVDFKEAINNPSLLNIGIPLIIILLFFFALRYITKLFSNYMNSELEKIKKCNEEFFNKEKKEIEDLISNLKEFKDNKYVLREIQTVINTNAKILNGIVDRKIEYREDNGLGKLKEKFKPKKLNLIGVQDEQ